MNYLQPGTFSRWFYCSSGWPSSPHKRPVFPEFENLWPVKYPRKVSCGVRLQMCKTCCYLSKSSLPPLQATTLFLSTFPNGNGPITMLASVRSENTSWDSFEMSFCISVVTQWGMQALSQKRWCLSSQSWFISVLWEEQQMLHKLCRGSDVITQLPLAPHISLITNVDQDTL